MQRIILVSALVLGGLVDAFFALVNFYPVAPKASRGPTRYLVAEMTKTQGDWFQSHVLDEFNETYNVDLKLRRVDLEEQILPAVKAAEAGANDVVLFMMPRNQGERAQAQGLVGSFAATIHTDFARDLTGVDAALVTEAQVDGKQQYLPASAILDVAVYRKSKVRDAVENWEQLRPEIDRVLAAWNGRGLPAGYDLELSPQRWDSFDAFVMAYYWAHCRYADEAPRPRVAHRTGSEIDGETDISAGIFRFGGTSATIDQPNSPAAVDYFSWEALYRDQGLYVADMLEADPYDDEAVLEGLEDGSIYLSAVDQMEAYALHGGSQRNADALARDAEDLGFTNIPSGTSLMLDAQGARVPVGTSFSFREDSVFALPKGGRAPLLAYRLVQYTLSPEVHTREVEALGYLPIQKDVVDQRASLFRLGWMTDVLSAGRTQWRRSEPMPPSIVLGTGSVYAQLWDTLVRQQGYGSPGAAHAAITAALAAPPKGEPLADEAAPPVVADAPGAGEPSATGPTRRRRRGPPRPTDSDDWPGVVVPTPVAAAVPAAPHGRKGGGR